MPLITTNANGPGPYAAAAAVLSLLTMWPFVAAAAGLRTVGDPADRLGLKRAAGWFVLANLAGLGASAAGRYLGAAWAAAVPLVNDPLFQIAHQEWAIPLDLVPFFVLSLVVETLTLWGMNLRPPRPERVRRVPLAGLAAGKNGLAYLVIGLSIWVELPATLGGYEWPVSPAELAAGPASADVRIWFIPPGRDEVRSVELDGTEERIEWRGPTPRPFQSLWLVPRRRKLVFVGVESLTVVDLATGKQASVAAQPTEAGKVARPPATPEELAPCLGVAPDEIQPRNRFIPIRGGRPDELTPSAAKELRQLDAVNRDAWVRRFGGGRSLPTVPARPAWLDEQELQAVDLGRWIVANYGSRLLLLDPAGGAVAALNVSAEDFVVVAP